MGMNIAERVKQIVIENLELQGSEGLVVPEARFVEDLQADMVDIVALVMDIELGFDIEIGDDARENIQTVGQAIALVETHLANRV